MVHDFRATYGYSPFDVPSKVGWPEALLNFEMIKHLPQSYLAVELSEGKVTRPYSLAEVPLHNMLDVLIASNSKKKPKPVARPWNSGKKKIGKAVPMAVGKAFFAKLGHKLKEED